MRAADPAACARVVCRGPGPIAADRSARDALASGCRILVSWGSAGALGDMAAGELLIAGRIVPCDGPALECDRALLARWTAALPAARVGAIAETARPLVSRSEKRALRTRTDADAVDMESAAVARAAEAAGAAWLCVRAIVDPADADVPPAALAGMDGPRTRPGRVLMRLLESPRQLGPVLRLARGARRARAALVDGAGRLPSSPSRERDHHQPMHPPPS